MQTEHIRNALQGRVKSVPVQFPHQNDEEKGKVSRCSEWSTVDTECNGKETDILLTKVWCRGGEYGGITGHLVKDQES